MVRIITLLRIGSIHGALRLHISCINIYYYSYLSDLGLLPYFPSGAIGYSGPTPTGITANYLLPYLPFPFVGSYDVQIFTMVLHLAQLLVGVVRDICTL